MSPSTYGKVLVTEQRLYEIANAIRHANGGTDLYRPIDMAPAIRALKSTFDSLIDAQKVYIEQLEEGAFGGIDYEGNLVLNVYVDEDGILTFEKVGE